MPTDKISAALAADLAALEAERATERAELELQSLNRQLSALYYRKGAEERGMNLHVVRLAQITRSIAEGEERRVEILAALKALRKAD